VPLKVQHDMCQSKLRNTASSSLFHVFALSCGIVTWVFDPWGAMCDQTFPLFEQALKHELGHNYGYCCTTAGIGQLGGSTMLLYEMVIAGSKMYEEVSVDVYRSTCVDILFPYYECAMNRYINK
jgi:hypothetical protein